MKLRGLLHKLSSLTLPASTRARNLALAVFLLAAAAPRVWLAVSDQGIFYPDEIYQTLEQAHRIAFGTGLVPWEFHQGARSWFFPGFLGMVLHLARLLGTNHAPTIVIVAKMTMVALGLTSIAATMSLARALAGDTAFWVAGVLAAAFPPELVYGARCMTEMAAAPLLTVSALLLTREGRKAAAVAGVAAGCAFLCRYQTVIFVAGFAGCLLATRRRGAAAAFSAAAVAFVGLGGALDWVTWGSPFHSVIEYFKFNLIEGKASLFGTAPFDFYARTAWTSTGWPIVLIALGFFGAMRRAPLLCVLVAIFVLAHSCIPHKEFRFLMPAVPLFLALSAVGWGVFRERSGTSAWAYAGVSALLVVQMGAKASGETFSDMGQSRLNGEDEASGSVWHASEGVNRALWEVGEREDACGLLVVAHWPRTGGYSYLHREIPITFDAQSVRKEDVNYVIAPSNLRMVPAYSTIARFGEVNLWRRRGSCGVGSSLASADEMGTSSATGRL